MAYGSDITESIGNVGGRTTAQGFNSADDVRKQYTGYERDDESGLDYAQARYYNSNHGRFTSVDPLTASANVKDPQTFNRYSYVLNSPYKFTDPLGLISVGTGACGGWCGNSGGSGGGGGGGASPYQAFENSTTDPTFGRNPTQGEADLPPTTSSQVEAPYETYDEGFTIQNADGTSVQFDQGSIDVTPALPTIVSDAEYAFERGKQEMVLFEVAIKQLQADLNNEINALTSTITGRIIVGINGTPELPNYQVGQLLPNDGGELSAGFDSVFDFSVKVSKGSREAVKTYNDFVLETDKEVGTRRESFVENNRNTFFNAQVSNKTPIQGWMHRVGNRSVTLTPETLRKIHTRRVNIGRSAGQMGL